VLPSYNRRAWLRAFWLTMSLTLGILTALLVGTRPGTRAVIGLAVTVAAVIPGMLRPDLARPPLRAWNALARLFARAGTAYLTAVCFHVVIRAMRRTGSPLRLHPPAPGESLWTPWPEERTDHVLADGIVAARSPGSGWAGDFVSWVRRSRQDWGLALLPMLLVLATFDTTQDVEAPPPGIYTLY